MDMEYESVEDDRDNTPVEEASDTDDDTDDDYSSMDDASSDDSDDDFQVRRPPERSESCVSTAEKLKGQFRVVTERAQARLRTSSVKRKKATESSRVLRSRGNAQGKDDIAPPPHVPSGHDCGGS